MKRPTFLFLLSLLPVILIPQDMAYIVKRGDTLYALSRRFDTPLDELMRANNIRSPKEFVSGLKIVIPGQSSSGNSTRNSSSNRQRYTVKKGDTLYSIAKRNHLPVKELQSLNGLKDNTLRVGQSLILQKERGSQATNQQTRQQTTNQVLNKQPVTNQVSTKQVATNQVATNQVARKKKSISVSRGGELEGSAKEKSTPSPTSVVVSSPQKSKTPPSSSRQQQGEWPIKGVVEPLSGKLEGIKILADSRGLITSVYDGKVVWIGPYRGFGKVVLISTKDFIFIYGGNEEIFVNLGQQVKKGTPLGSTSSATTPEVYFAVYKNGKAVHDIQSIL